MFNYSLLVRIVRFNRLRLNDNGRIATLEVLTFVSDGTSDVAGCQTNRTKENHTTRNDTHHQQFTTLLSHSTLNSWTEIGCKGTTFF